MIAMKEKTYETPRITVIEIIVEQSIVPCEDRNKKSQVGTISYIPAVFGCVCAQAAVQHLMAQGKSDAQNIHA